MNFPNKNLFKEKRIVNFAISNRTQKDAQIQDSDI